MLGALPGTTLPIYPDLGQAPNTLAFIPGGLQINKAIFNLLKSAHLNMLS